MQNGGDSVTVEHLIEMLTNLPQDATIGISEYFFLNTTGYDELEILDKSDIDIDIGVNDLDYYLVGRHKEWEDERKEAKWKNSK